MLNLKEFEDMIKEYLGVEEVTNIGEIKDQLIDYVFRVNDLTLIQNSESSIPAASEDEAKT